MNRTTTAASTSTASKNESLSDLTPASANPGVLGVLGMSEDGSIVYFVASAVLAGGASAGLDNLYVVQGGVIDYITTLSGEDGSDWTQSFQQRTARVTPDGEHLAFLSQASLTGYDNADVVTGNPSGELFVYDVRERRLTCVSCDPSGARPVGPARVPPGTSPSYEPHHLRRRKSRVLRQQGRAGAGRHERPGERLRVRGWDRLPYLPGTSSEKSALVDTSAEGRDVFFTTRSARRGRRRRKLGHLRRARRRRLPDYDRYPTLRRRSLPRPARRAPSSQLRL